jgi:hypothetical protein
MVAANFFGLTLPLTLFLVLMPSPARAHDKNLLLAGGLMVEDCRKSPYSLTFAFHMMKDQDKL